MARNWYKMFLFEPKVKEEIKEEKSAVVVDETLTVKFEDNAKLESNTSSNFDGPKPNIKSDSIANPKEKTAVSTPQDQSPTNLYISHPNSPNHLPASIFVRLVWLASTKEPI